MTREVLAFGDSLTWGADPVTGLRHPASGQWPRVLEAALSGVRIHADGVGGRTTCRDDDAGAAPRNGAKALPVALSAHMPLDLVILMLGTNDLKAVHGGRADGAQAGMKRLAEIVTTFPYKPQGAVPRLLIVAPPPTGPGAAGGRDPGEARRITPLYRALAKELGCGFFDAGEVASVSPADQVHLDAEATAAIGRALVAPVKELLA
jgi:lysophospholipase L1-like esterase